MDLAEKKCTRPSDANMSYNAGSSSLEKDGSERNVSCNAGSSSSEEEGNVCAHGHFKKCEERLGVKPSQARHMTPVEEGARSWIQMLPATDRLCVQGWTFRSPAHDAQNRPGEWLTPMSVVPR
eukprot:4163801-Pyramimonas_sp.AAC.1